VKNPPACPTDLEAGRVQAGAVRIFVAKAVHDFTLPPVVVFVVVFVGTEAGVKVQVWNFGASPVVVTSVA